MKATLLLCDAAQVEGGKLSILGGGWTLTGPGPVTCALALLLDVPWDRTNHQITLSMELRDQDGNVVHQPGPAGQVPVRVDAQFEVGRPPGTAPGTPIPVPLAIPVVGIQLTPGRRFYWELTIDGETRDDWTLHFQTRPMPVQQQPGGPTEFQL